MAPSSPETFTFVNADAPTSLWPDYQEASSAKVTDLDVQITASLRKLYPELNLTAIPSDNAPLIQFANAGYATATLDTDTDSILRWRGYVPAGHRGGSGALGDMVFYAKYHYKWSGEDFIVYTVSAINNGLQYVLKEPDTSKNENTLSHCAATDALIMAAVKVALGDETQFIYVYDRYWQRSKSLWEQVQKASWNNVILAPSMKKELSGLTKGFFDSQDVYKKYGVPWRRGILMYGPPGNGKTISLKALMHELYARKADPIPTLYVKAAPTTFDLRQVFLLARMMSPCLLVMEDVETIVTPDTRSYFFNEVDGLESNDGILMVASTNYLDRLDPGITKRPSRFDRKYLFPLPSLSQRVLYAEYWRKRLEKTNDKIDFPHKLCPAIAKITYDFSFAYMQEAFVAALLELARNEVELAVFGGQSDHADAPNEADVFHAADEEQWYEAQADESSAQRLEDYYERDQARTYSSKEDPLDEYKLWRALKNNITALRKDLEHSKGQPQRNSSLEPESARILSPSVPSGREVNATDRFAIPPIANVESARPRSLRPFPASRGASASQPHHHRAHDTFPSSIPDRQERISPPIATENQIILPHRSTTNTRASPRYGNMLDALEAAQADLNARVDSATTTFNDMFAHRRHIEDARPPVGQEPVASGATSDMKVREPSADEVAAQGVNKMYYIAQSAFEYR